MEENPELSIKKWGDDIRAAKKSHLTIFIARIRTTEHSV